jgi:hypothetical protein
MISDTGQIVNKVASANLLTIDLDKLIGRVEVVSCDIKDFLFMELMLKEKEFRVSLDTTDWSSYKGKIVAIHCSNDAILPPWAFSLVAAKLIEIAAEIYQGTPDSVFIMHIQRLLDQHDWSSYKDKRVILKGCNDRSIPSEVYTIAATKLIGIVDRLMYGEACSFVPLWRK